MNRERFINGLKETIKEGNLKPFTDDQLRVIRKLHMAIIKPEDFPNMPNGENDIHICIEECGELIQALTKILRGTGGDPINLLEELVDVQVSIEQMKVVFNISETAFQAAYSVKLQRLNRNILKKLEDEIDTSTIHLCPSKSAYVDKYDVEEALNAIFIDSEPKGE